MRLILKWGRKIGLTPEEEELLETCKAWERRAKRKHRVPNFYPDKILEEDACTIRLEIRDFSIVMYPNGESYIADAPRVETNEVLNNPHSLEPALAHTMVMVMQRGPQKYYLTPPYDFDYSSSPSSTETFKGG